MQNPKKHRQWIGEVLFFLFSALFSAAAVGLAWRDTQWGWLAIFGLGMFFLAQLRYKKLWVVTIHGLLTGYLCFVVANTWMFWTVDLLVATTPAKVAALVQVIHLMHGAMWGLFAICWWLARRFLPSGWLLAPAIWLILESFWPAMFPLRYGCLLLEYKPLIQIASVFGITGVSFQMLAMAGLIPTFWFSHDREFSSQAGEPRSEQQPDSWSLINPRIAQRCFATLLVLTLANGIWGAWRIDQLETADAQSTSEKFDALIVQGDTEVSATFYQDMADRARVHTDTCELVIWPECAFGRYNQALTDFSDDVQVSLNSLGINYSFRPMPDPDCYLMGAGYSWTGNLDAEKIDSKYVSAFLLDPQEQLAGRHDKVKLMAGGEYIPGQFMIPGLAEWLYSESEEYGQEDDDPFSGEITRGKKIEPIGLVNDVSVGALICCEDMYPELSRELAQKGADVLVCMGNSMSFNSEIALRQHYYIALFRAIENNLYLLRCDSYGVSGLISPAGKLTATAPAFEEADIRVSIPSEERSTTAFTTWGDTLLPFSYICVALFVCCRFLPVFKTSPNTVEAPPQPGSVSHDRPQTVGV